MNILLYAFVLYCSFFNSIVQGVELGTTSFDSALTPCDSYFTDESGLLDVMTTGTMDTSDTRYTSEELDDIFSPTTVTPISTTTSGIGSETTTPVSVTSDEGKKRKAFSAAVVTISLHAASKKFDFPAQKDIVIKPKKKKRETHDHKTSCLQKTSAADAAGFTQLDPEIYNSQETNLGSFKTYLENRGIYKDSPEYKLHQKERRQWGQMNWAQEHRARKKAAKKNRKITS